MDADPQDLLTAALDYIRRYGWAVFPVPPGTKKSYKSGRYGNNNPWGMTRSVELVEQDFKKWPEAGVGVPTGWVNGIFVVETDTLEGHGVDGLAGLRALEAEHGVLPETLMAELPTGAHPSLFRLAETAGRGHQELRREARARGRCARRGRHGGRAADPDQKRPLPLA